MRNIIAKASDKLSNLFVAKNSDSGNASEVERWFQNNGDSTLRLDYDLTADSFVMDLGGYKGEWTKNIFTKYRCNVLIFEPYIPFFKKIESRFANNNNIKAYGFGLSGKNQIVQFSVADNGSSVFNKSNKKAEIQLKDIKEFLEEHTIPNVDLIKINIEGGEYDLLEAMIDKGIIRMFRNIQVQFHNFFPEAKDRMNKIQENLSKTHELTYQFEFVWENWRLKS